ncbi:MAG: ferritin-like domain-containing protein, partial [Alphaproteobacteria bacterium]|nr:ferritin-like domain-containing protein [Alphaproteobacteria bacterium]
MAQQTPAEHPSRPLQRDTEAPSIRIGSEAHKVLFCRMLLDTHDPYKPAVIDWPELDEDALARLTGLPFWDVAVETEERAAAHIALMGAQENDPLIKEALDLMAFEERRHKDVIGAMVRHYRVPMAEEQPYTPPPHPQRCFMSTGYGECLDSFFAFG